MAKKAKTVFVCQECGYESHKWQGQCICGAWNSFVEEALPDISYTDQRRRLSKRSAGKGKKAIPEPLRSIGTGGYERIDTGIGELNRVLGGGIVKGSMVLISGEPGIGKSTIIVQTASNVAAGGGKVLYISGEESEEQIKMRADRVCGEVSENLLVLSETNMDNIAMICEKQEHDFLIIDSIQTMYTDTLDSAPGSVSQVRACGGALMKLAKAQDIAVFIVAHVTKRGDLAGPKIVEHLVDCVLSFNGERDNELRIMRAFKNRFGTTSEIGAFKMIEQGLVEISDLSGTFVDHTAQLEGSIISAVYEGSRPMLVEVQALTSTANVGFPRRTAVGIDSQRLAMIIAVLEKKAGLVLSDKDIYVNVVGGLKIDSTAVDLALALAIYSSLRDMKMSISVVVVGEIGLTGEIRTIRGADKILMEAHKMGYKGAIIPNKNASPKDDALDDLKVIAVRSIIEAIEAFKRT